MIRYRLHARYLFDGIIGNLQIEQLPPHGNHHLLCVAGSSANVLTRGRLPLTVGGGGLG